MYDTRRSNSFSGRGMKRSVTAAMKPLEHGEFTAKLNGLELWYKVSGVGPVCVFPTPGWGPSSDLYFRSLSRMERFFTMVYLDTRGSGRSQQPNELTEYRYEQFSADLEALRLHLGREQIWVMGHSGGGWLAMHYAIAYPPGCCGLVLVDATAANDAEWKEDVAARHAELRDRSSQEEEAKVSSAASEKDDEKAFADTVRSGMRLAFHDVANLVKLEGMGGSLSLVLGPIPGTDLTTTTALRILRFIKNIEICKETVVVERRT